MHPHPGGLIAGNVIEFDVAEVIPELAKVSVAAIGAVLELVIPMPAKVATPAIADTVNVPLNAPTEIDTVTLAVLAVKFPYWSTMFTFG